jgi:hypothetical protein
MTALLIAVLIMISLIAVLGLVLVALLVAGGADHESEAERVERAARLGEREVRWIARNAFLAMLAEARNDSAADSHPERRR